jgi:hypothetical protein
MPEFDYKDLIWIEEDRELLNYRFVHDDTLMWPFARFYVLQSCINSIFGFQSPYAANKRAHSGNALKYLYHTLAYSPFSFCKGCSNDITIFSSGAVNIKTERGYYNRLYDDLAAEFKQSTLILEDSINREYRRPRFFGNVRYADLFYLAAAISSRTHFINAADKKRIDEFVIFLKSSLKYPLEEGFWIKLKHLLFSTSGKLPVLYSLLKKFFMALKPKIILVEDGSYGDRAYLFKLAKILGIKSGEIQHGIFCKSHSAYNYGSCIFGSSYEDYLPEFLLTFGEYWKSQINMPVKTVTIGNPYLTKESNSATNIPGKRKKILFISSGTLFVTMVDLILSIKERFPSKFDIFFRPHPLEESLIKDRYKPLIAAGISFDRNNLYNSLRAYDYIVGIEATTVLYEATAFRKRIFLLNAPHVSLYVDPDIFEVFNNADHLVEMILNGNPKSYNPDDFWCRDWKNNYANFIKKTIGLNH